MGCVARALRDEQRDTKVRKELRQQLRLRMEEIDHLRGEQEELRQPNTLTLGARLRRQAHLAAGDGGDDGHDVRR